MSPAITLSVFICSFPLFSSSGEACICNHGIADGYGVDHIPRGALGDIRIYSLFLLFKSLGHQSDSKDNYQACSILLNFNFA